MYKALHAITNYLIMSLIHGILIETCIYIAFWIISISVLSIEPAETITFIKEGNDIAGTITLKNIAPDKTLSYKASVALYSIMIMHYLEYISNKCVNVTYMYDFLDKNNISWKIQSTTKFWNFAIIRTKECHGCFAIWL